MTPNILYFSNQFYGTLHTLLEEWPKEPTLNHNASLVEYSTTGFQNRLKEYEQEIKEALKKCVPIVDDDQDRVRKIIKTMLVNDAPFSESQRKWLLTEPLFVMQGKREDQLTKDELRWYNADKSIIVNGTIYKDTGIELEEVEQFWAVNEWAKIPDNWDKKIDASYRKAYKNKIDESTGIQS